MNDFLTARIPEVVLSGDARADLIAFFGPQGDRFQINVPEGFLARIYDFSVYAQAANDMRYGFNLMRTPVGPSGVRAWNSDADVMNDGGQIAALSYVNQFVGSGAQDYKAPHSELLWPLDYRLALPPRVAGFAQVTAVYSFRMRYILVRATASQIAAVLFWQNQGVQSA